MPMTREVIGDSRCEPVGEQVVGVIVWFSVHLCEKEEKHTLETRRVFLLCAFSDSC